MPDGPVLVERTPWLDFDTATALADPQLDLATPLKGPFRAIALVAPEAALSPSGETQYVYRVRDGVAERREVTIGERREGRVEILTGVAAKDMLVVSGLQRVTDGAAVTIVDNGQ